jgi:hypothetical protein
MMNQPSNFNFDEVNHIYRLNNRTIPSVTQVLQAEGITDYSYADESDREFGKAGHKVTELWDKGKLDIKTISEPLIPCLEAWKKFLKDFEVTIFPGAIEKPIYSSRYLFGTTPDRVGLVNDKVTVIELKFSKTIQRSTGIQLAAQAIAATEHYGKVRQRMAVPLLGGKPQFFNDRQDETIFISALNLWRWKNEN